MEQLTREMMIRTFDKLTPDQLDDVESQFENLQVLFERVAEASHEEKTHLPAIELHVGELTETLFQGIIGLLRTPALSQAQANFYLDQVRHLIWDYIKGSVLFGREIGRVNWPMREYTCVEVHQHD